MDEKEWESLKGIDWLHDRQTQTVEQAIDENLIRLRDQHLCFVYKAGFDAWIEEWTKQVQEGRVTNALLAEKWADHMLRQAENSETIPFVHSTIFTCMAKEAVKQGKIEEAWPLISYASFCAGVADVISSRIRNAPTEQTEVSALGGKKRGESFEKIKNEVVRLLNAPPPGGWLKRKATGITLTAEIAKFIKEREAIIKEREAIVKEREIINKNNNANNKDKVAIKKERAAIKEEKAAIKTEKSQLNFPDLGNTIYRWLGEEPIRSAFKLKKAENKTKLKLNKSS